MNAADARVYVSNADSGDISVLSLDLASGTLAPLQTLALHGQVMPLALSPDRRFLYVGVRGQPQIVASFAIDPASGRLNHLGNAPLDASMAYTTTDRTGKWLLAASYPGGKLTVNPIAGDGKAQAPPDISCRGCHEQHAATDHVFTQFYPTLRSMSVKS